MSDSVREDGESGSGRGPLNSRSILLKNSLANLVRSVSTSAIMVFLPLVLVLILARAEYAVWALVFSIAGYVMYFDVGVPAAVQSLAARARAEQDPARERAVVRSSLRVSSLIGLCFVLCTAGIALALPAVSPEMPTSLRTAAAAALVVLSVGQAANLVANSAAAYFSGLQRSWLPTGVLVPSRLLSFAGACLLAAVGSNLVVVAAAYSVPLVIGTVILIARALAESRGDGDTRPRNAKAAFRTRDLLRYTGPLIIWGVCTLGATGLGTIIIGRFAWEQIAIFSMASIVSTGISGVATAAAMPLLPDLARAESQDSSLVAGRLMKAIRVYSAFLFSVGSGALLVLPWYLSIVLDAGDRRGDVWWLTAVLMVTATLLHMSCTPLSLGFIATGRHHRLILSPVAQAVVTIAGSLALAPMFGAAGVAAATLIGTGAGVLLTFFWSIRRAEFTSLRPASVAWWSAGMPFLGYLLVLGTTVGLFLADLTGTVLGSSLALLACVGCVLWQWFGVLPGTERARLISKVTARSRGSRSR